MLCCDNGKDLALLSLLALTDLVRNRHPKKAHTITKLHMEDQHHHPVTHPVTNTPNCR
jgi:hypothetical protein